MHSQKGRKMLSGQSEMIELVIIVVAVVMLIMMVYSFFTANLSMSGTMLAEKHKNDRMMFICTFLPRIYIDGINKTVGESLSTSITTGKTMLYYGRSGIPVNVTFIIEQILDSYLDKGYWNLKLSDEMHIGAEIPEGVDTRTCRIAIPLLTYKGNITNIYLYRW